MEDPSPERRWEASDIVADFRLADLERNIVARLHKETEPLVLACLADAAARVRSRAALPDIRKLLEHEDSLVRAFAASAVGMSGESADRALLNELLSNEDDARVRTSTIGALFRLGDRTALARMDGEVSDQAGELQATYVLSELRDLATVDPMLGQLGGGATISATVARIRSIYEGAGIAHDCDEVLDALR